MRTVRIIARAEASLAHIYGFQHLLLATVQLFGAEEQRRRYFQETARNRWFWGNALNPLDKTTRLTTVDGRRIVNGRKGFSSGSVDADMMIISALEEGNPRMVIAAVPAARAGMVALGDWDNMGQRQTDSGTVDFTDVELMEWYFSRYLTQLLIDITQSTPKGAISNEVLRPLCSGRA